MEHACDRFVREEKGLVTLILKIEKEIFHRFHKNFIVELNDIPPYIIFLQLHVVDNFMVEGLVVGVDGLVSTSILYFSIIS